MGGLVLGLEDLCLDTLQEMFECAAVLCTLCLIHAWKVVLMAFESGLEGSEIDGVECDLWAVGREERNVGGRHEECC